MNRPFKLTAIRIILAVFTLVGCETGAQRETAQLSGLKLYVFDCGRLRFEDISAFSISNEETDIRDLAVPCYVIEHDRGYLLWDGGLPSATAEQEGWHGEGMRSRLDRTLADQLPDIGLDMSAFRYVAFSHFHFDHVGVANEVRDATMLVQATEYAAVFVDQAEVPGVETSLISRLPDLNRVELTGDHDVFGDGSVRIVSAPGHTPGHQVLWVDLQNHGPVVLSGDLYHFRLSREDRRVPSFNWDPGATLESFDKVEHLLEESGAELWIEHDLAGFEQLRKAPEFYN